MNAYRIKNWNDLYENNRSRTVKDLAWVPIPNRHDGESYSRLMLRKDASEVFSAWILLLQVASRCHPRGTLLRSDGKPHDFESLSIKTRSNKSWFEKAIPVLMQMSWLEQVAVDCQEDDITLTPSCQSGDEEGKEGMNGKKGMEPPLREEVIEAWNSMEILPKIMSLTEKRRKTIKARLDDQFFTANWRTALAKVLESAFCTGTNDRGWKADIDWFLKPDSVPMIMEGKYDNKKTSFVKKWESRPSLQEIEAADEARMKGVSNE